MLDAISFDDMIEKLNKSTYGREITIGILLAQPNSNFVKDEILNRIEYYYMRSFDNIDFYFPGYGAYWPEYKYPDKKDICKINNVNWSYSTQSFIGFIEKLEKKSKFKYSGETELLVIKYSGGKLDFSEVLIFWLDRMVKDEIIYSVPSFFEKLFRTFNKAHYVSEASDVLAFNQLAINLFDVGIDNLPFKLGKTFMNTKYFCTKNIGRRTKSYFR